MKPADVLLIDDENEILSLLEMFFNDLGHTCSRYGGVEEFLEREGLEQLEKYKIALIDQNMQGISGSEFISQIKISKQFPQFFLMSGEYIDLEQFATNVNITLLLKPFELEELEKKLI